MLDLFGYSLAAGLSTLVGGVLVLGGRRYTSGVLAFCLGLAAGVMGTIVIVDLVPFAVIIGGYRYAALGICTGLLAMKPIGGLVRASRWGGGGYWVGLGYVVALGIAFHDFPEGLGIAAGYAAHPRLGLLLALGIGVHNVPEGMAVAAALLAGGRGKGSILGILFLVAAVTPLGAAIGLLVAGISRESLGLCLGLAAGAMGYIVCTELVPGMLSLSTKEALRGAALGAIIMLVANF